MLYGGVYSFMKLVITHVSHLGTMSFALIVIHLVQEQWVKPEQKMKCSDCMSYLSSLGRLSSQATLYFSLSLILELENH